MQTGKMSRDWEGEITTSTNMAICQPKDHRVVDQAHLLNFSGCRTQCIIREGISGVAGGVDALKLAQLTSAVILSQTRDVNG